MQNTAIKFNLSLMDNDTILKNVYLADHEKNMEIFAALMQGKEAINKYLPNHFWRLKLCCMEVCTLLSSPDIHNFI